MKRQSQSQQHHHQQQSPLFLMSASCHAATSRMRRTSQQPMGVESERGARHRFAPRLHGVLMRHHTDDGSSSSDSGLARRRGRHLQSPPAASAGTQIRRTVSDDDRINGGNGRISTFRSRALLQRRESLLMKQEENQKRTSGLYAYSRDRSGDKECFETYSFWSSTPSLVMFGSVVLAVVFQNIHLVYVALLVFLYEVGVVMSKWKGFIVNHPLVQDCVDVTGWWIRYGLHQVDLFLDKNDRTRKAAFGMFLVNLDLTSNVLGGYLQQRKEEVAKRTLAEAQRLRDRFHNVAS